MNQNVRNIVYTFSLVFLGCMMAYILPGFNREAVGGIYIFNAYSISIWLLLGVVILFTFHAFARQVNKRDTEAALLENIGVILFKCEKDLVVTYVSQKPELVLGFSSSSILGQKITELVESPVDLELKLNLLQHDSEEVVSFSGRTLTHDNSEVCKITVRPSSVRGQYEGVIQNITQSIVLEQNSLLSKQVFESTAEGICITNAENEIIMINNAFTKITGFTEEESIGQNPSILSSGYHDEAFYEELWSSLEANDSWEGEVWNKDKEGSTYPEWLRIDVIRNQENEISNFIATFSDISRIKDYESEADKAFKFDPLTGLINRNYFYSLLKHSAESYGNSGSIIFIDIDDFKSINDVLGFTVGDDLLRLVADRLQSCLRDEDVICRLTADEFCIYLSGEGDHNDAFLVSEKLKKELEVVYCLNGQDLTINVSIGIANVLQETADPSNALMHAEIAMYEAKQQRSIAIYSPEMTSLRKERFHARNRIKEGLLKGQFEVYYQPQVSTLGLPICFEALIRWNVDDKVIPPSEFISSAEENGSIIDIGTFVLESVCNQVVEWKGCGLVFDHVAVNLSARQLTEDNLFESISEIILRTGCDPSWLELEVTETVVMEDSVQCLSTLERLRDMGIKLSIDDFGTGYSSLSYLKRLPFSILKIDRCFIQGIGESSSDEQIVKAVQSMASALELKTIAEGVETHDQEVFLKAIGVNYIQGYLYSKPLPADQIKQQFLSVKV